MKKRVDLEFQVHLLTLLKFIAIAVTVAGATYNFVFFFLLTNRLKFIIILSRFFRIKI